MEGGERRIQDSELIEGLLDFDAKDVMGDFWGLSMSDFRQKLEEVESMDLMFTYSIVSAKGFAFFFPAIDDYARSLASDGDFMFPGPFAHAVENQLRINSEAVLAVENQVRSLCQYLLAQLEKFDLDEKWKGETSATLVRVLKALG